MPAESTYAFEDTTRYNVIYVFSVDLPDHKGCLKIGKASIADARSYDTFPPNCAELNKAAMERIRTYTNTVGVKPNLLHTEIAVREKTVSPGRCLLETFDDKAVHAVLKHSSIKKVVFTGTTADEWFEVDLPTVKRAIKAVKEYMPSLHSGEVSHEAPPVILREEQREAVDRTLERFKKKNDMLWDAKMRFGKTLTALQVVKQGGFQKVAIITHRPVVNSGWQDDFGKIFRTEDAIHYHYIDKSALSDSSFDHKAQEANDAELGCLVRDHRHFIYFASIQDLRGSQRVGGKFKKNEGVFNLDWDLVIIDEAHEGTQTTLGDAVVTALVKKKTKVLALSGTPFNILDQYEEEAVYVWDYVMEQERKETWPEKHPDEPNPYADLPRLNIYTYSLGEKFEGYTVEDLEGKAFNFREFFRTWTGDADADGRRMPEEARVGGFVHEQDVQDFLNLITMESADSRYPFSTPAYRELFKHTLWMVPGVAAARALSDLLRNHSVFQHFGIANVAGEGDDYEDTHYDDALKQVRNTIEKHEYTITLSCGKLTTGVTVPEWTGVMMLSGSVNTSASSYMQTIFRVQSASKDGRRKENAYVFDFAPDRTLRVLAETVQISRRVAKNDAREEKARQALAEFLNYCPVIAISGTTMREYDVPKMMGQLKHVFVTKAIKNGFDDASIYSEKLLHLDEVDATRFEELKRIVGTSKQTVSPDSVTVNDEEFDDEEHADKGGKRPKRDLTEEEKRERAEARKRKEERKHAISILRALSIRMPMLIYGADVPVDQEITLQGLVDMVDEASWREFMPKGVTKELFADFIKYYDADVFVNAGKEIRRLARSADKLAPTERVKQIARIFGYFKNPDKETVLTPWRVVNMHLSDTIGGWCFWNTDFTEPLEQPRYVQQAEVTAGIFGKTDARVLEINSKSGLYPLYIAYSLYRNANGTVPDDAIEAAWRTRRWKEVVAKSLFVVCKTPMAAAITRRTLMGYQKGVVNTRYYENLVDTLKKAPETFVTQVKNGSSWNNEELKMKQLEFDAVVGNPPYQMHVGGVAPLAIYHYFVTAAKVISPEYISMIIPSRWFNTGAGTGLDGFRDSMLKDKHLRCIHDYIEPTQVFPNVEIKGGVLYFLWRKQHAGMCDVVTHHIDGKVSAVKRDLLIQGMSLYIRDTGVLSILQKVQSKQEDSLASIISPRDPFGYDIRLPGSYKRAPHKYSLEKSKDADVEFYSILWRKEGIGYVSLASVSENREWVDKWKVLIPKAWGTGKTQTDCLKPFVIPPHSVCTETYLVAGAFDDEESCKNLISYINTRFFHLLVSVLKISHNAAKGVYKLVPMQDFSQSWTDEKLYDKYGLTAEERAYIEATIRPME